MTKSQLLQDNLFLNKYYCSLFGNANKRFESLEDFRNIIQNKEEFFNLEFFRGFVLDENLRRKIDTYNQNIQEYLDKINAKRENQIQLKYFQYLAILFTEIHLDRYLEDKESFREDIVKFCLSIEDAPTDFTCDELRKIAVWSATGSGKTILMHINYLQTVHYSKEYGNNKNVDNFFLITPNEGLTKQHKEELELSSLNSEVLNPQSLSQDSLSKWSDSFGKIKILDNHKIIEADESKTKNKKKGVKRIDSESLGTRNIVFVDEGHKGNKTEQSIWKTNRNRLIQDFGFLFEYSATFAESIGKKGSDGFLEYSKSIIFDYRYKYFYSDGYGKDYSILNLSKETEDNLEEYLTGALLSFYEQKILFNDSAKNIFNIENPLMIFVGSKVAGDKSDIAKTIKFFSDFVNNKDKFIEYIENILHKNTSLIDSKTKIPIYESRLKHLKNFNSKELYQQILNKLFYAGDNKIMTLSELSSEGEIGLKFKNDWFGVINVGNPKDVIKEVEKICSNVILDSKEITHSLFEDVQEENSKINFVIGSKKFIEGWNCYRVSSMGIMNMGKSEGAQIIQLFGRGVRLRGYDGLLKRTGILSKQSNIRHEIPLGIEEIETLKIFGLSAKYMEVFREVLEKEGMSKKDAVKEIKIKKNFPTKRKLYVPYLSKKEEDFFEDIEEIEINSPESPQIIDLETLIEVSESKQVKTEYVREKKEGEINKELFELLDYQKINLKLKDFCFRKKISNIYFTHELIRKIINEMRFSVIGDINKISLDSNNSIENLTKLEKHIIDIFQKLIKDSVEVKKKEWEIKNMSYELLGKDDEKLLAKETCRIEYDSSNLQLARDIEKTEELIEEWDTKGNILGDKEDVVHFQFLENHLFYPLIYVYEDENSINKEIVTITPTPLVRSENDFIEKFLEYLERNKENIDFDELYLLRNNPKTGTGFSMPNGRFYPDFILWGIKDDLQSIAFIDPKGIARMSEESDKIKFHKDIKNIQNKLKGVNKTNILLNSFIVTNTDFNDTKDNFHINSELQMNNMNIFFMKNNQRFIGDIFDRMKIGERGAKYEK